MGRRGHLLARHLPSDSSTRHLLRVHRGEPSPWVDARPTQRHLAKLTSWGLPAAGIAAAAGVSKAQVQAHLHTGHRHIYRHYAAALFAIDYMPHPAQELILTVGCRRRVHALAAQGHSITWQAEYLGLSSRVALQNLIRSPLMQPDRRPAIVALFDELADREGPSVKARAHAARLGYLSSWAWDADTIDNPDAAPVPYERDRDVDTKLGVDADWLMSAEGGNLSAEAVAGKFNVQVDSVAAAVSRVRQRRTLAFTHKVTDVQVADMRRRHAAGEQVKTLALEHGISKGHASGLIRGTDRARAPRDVEERLDHTG